MFSILAQQKNIFYKKINVIIAIYTVDIHNKRFYVKCKHFRG